MFKEMLDEGNGTMRQLGEIDWWFVWFIIGSTGLRALSYEEEKCTKRQTTHFRTQRSALHRKEFLPNSTLNTDID